MAPQGWKEDASEKVYARNSQCQDDERAPARWQKLPVKGRHGQVDETAEPPVLPSTRGSKRRCSAAVDCLLVADGCAALVDAQPMCRLARKFAETVEICVMSRNWRGYASVSQWRAGLVSWPLYPLASPSCLWVESLDLGKVVAAFPAMIRDRKGLQDHIFAKLTQIIAKFWRFAPVFQQDRWVFSTRLKLARL